MGYPRFRTGQNSLKFSGTGGVDPGLLSVRTAEMLVTALKHHN